MMKLECAASVAIALMKELPWFQAMDMSWVHQAQTNGKTVRTEWAPTDVCHYTFAVVNSMHHSIDLI